MKDSNEKRQIGLSPISFICGGLAGGLAKTIIAPLDRTKIYFQSHPSKGYHLSSALKFLSRTYKDSGFLSLWRGNSATMARILPYSAIQFMSHERYKILLNVHENSSSSQIYNGRHFIAGSLAGVTGQMITYPLDRARAILAVTKMGEYKNILSVFRLIIKTEGYAALFKGFAPTMIGVIPYAGTSFYTYETLVKYFSSKKKDKESISILQRLGCGATAGLLGQVSSYPFDIVRRRMQTANHLGHGTLISYNSTFGALQEIYNKEGIRRGWFKAVSMNFIKSPIVSGTCYTTYHCLKTLFEPITRKEK